MNVKRTLLTGFVMIFALQAFSQSNYEYFVTASSNFYVPVNNSSKGVYPILWYDKNSDPKFQVGGFGIGFTVLKSVKEKFILKGHADVSRHVYWDEPFEFRDPTNSPLGVYPERTIEYTIGLTASAHYLITNRFMVGTGLGTRVLLSSQTRLPDFSAGIGPPPSKTKNTFYKPILPVVPLEVSMKFEKVLWTIRYEQGLLNRYKGDLAKENTDKFGLLIFEVGIRVK